MSDEKRSEFFAKLLTGGLSAVVGVACLLGAVESYRSEEGIASVLLPLLALVLAVAFLRTAWRIFGE